MQSRAINLFTSTLEPYGLSRQVFKYCFPFNKHNPVKTPGTWMCLRVVIQLSLSNVILFSEWAIELSKFIDFDRNQNPLRKLVACRILALF